MGQYWFRTQTLLTCMTHNIMDKLLTSKTSPDILSHNQSNENITEIFTVSTIFINVLDDFTLHSNFCLI